jgi:hypothetical protein
MVHDFSRVPLFAPAASTPAPAVAGPQSESAFETTRTYRKVISYPLSVKIPKSTKKTPESDSYRGKPSVRSQPGRIGGDADDAIAGGDVRLSESAGQIIAEEGDSIGSTLTYRPAVSNSGPAPGPREFGVTRTAPSLSGLAVTQDAVAHAFNVTANVDNTVTWTVHSLGRTDIPNENAPAITNDNYTAVADDLTPNMSSDNGRPPRTHYWAQDLTERHEGFHANERANTYGRPAFEFAKTWLEAQAAPDVGGATALANRIPAKMHESYAASYAPGKESRAYGDGARLYQARADAIRRRFGGLSTGAKVGSGIGGGALVGAGIGAFGGPIGAAIGAGIGALVGGIAGAFL